MMCRSYSYLWRGHFSDWAGLGLGAAAPPAPGICSKLSQYNIMYFRLERETRRQHRGLVLGSRAAARALSRVFFCEKKKYTSHTKSSRDSSTTPTTATPQGRRPPSLARYTPTRVLRDNLQPRRTHTEAFASPLYTTDALIPPQQTNTTHTLSTSPQTRVPSAHPYHRTQQAAAAPSGHPHRNGGGQLVSSARGPSNSPRHVPARTPSHAAARLHHPIRPTAHPLPSTRGRPLASRGEGSASYAARLCQAGLGGGLGGHTPPVGHSRRPSSSTCCSAGPRPRPLARTSSCR